LRSKLKSLATGAENGEQSSKARDYSDPTLLISLNFQTANVFATDETEERKQSY
jgi:hypothetical protein